MNLFAINLLASDLNLIELLVEEGLMQQILILEKYFLKSYKAMKNEPSLGFLI